MRDWFNEEILQMKRNPSIELYRCLLMFGICFLHSIQFGKCGHPWYESITIWCVTGFVFITGYFGCKFAVSKIAKLYGIAFWCAIMSVLGRVYVDQNLPGGGVNIIVESWRQLTDYWFLHAYVFMMMLAPMVDSALESKRSIRLWLMPLVLLCFGWSLANAVLNSHPSIKWIIPNTPGLGAYTGLTLIGVYAVGRVYRLKRDKIHPPHWAWAALAIVSLIGCVFELGHYNSPCSVVLAIVGFMVCEKIRMPEWLGCAVMFVAPSMFSVYLLQTNRFFIPKFAMISEGLISLPLPMRYFCTACIVFVICTMCDFGRRIIVSIVRKMI